MSIWSNFTNGLSKIGSAIGSGYNTVLKAVGLGGNSNNANVFGSPAYIAKNVSLGLQPSSGPGSAYYATGNGNVVTGTSGGPVSLPSMSQTNASFMANNPQYGYNGAPMPISLSSGRITMPQNYIGGGSGGSSQNYSTLGNTYAAPVQTPVSQTVNGSGFSGSQPIGVIGAGRGGTQGVTAGDVYGYNAALGPTDINGILTDPNADKTKEAPKDKTIEDYIKEQQALSDAAPKVDTESIRAQANQDANLAAAQQQKNNTQSAVNAITAKMNTDLMHLRDVGSKEGVTEAVYGGQQAQITREATMKLLPLQAQLATDQGNLELAQKMSDDLFKYRYEDATNKADRWLKNAERGYENYTKAEQKKLDNVAKVYTDRKSTVSDLRNYVQATADDARKSGATGVWTALSAIQFPDPTSTNFEAQVQRINQIISQQGANIPVKETAADIKANQNVFTEAQKSLAQYKEQGYTRAEVEAEWRGANAVAGQKPEDVQMPLTIQRALDNLYGAAPVEATPASTSHWYNPLSWF